MSWWDSSAFSSFATNALKTAQERIDKVLDIQDDDDEANREVSSDNAARSLPQHSTSKQKKSESASNDFWSSYLGPDAITGFTSAPSKDVSKPTVRSPQSTELKGQHKGLSSSNKLKTSATSAFSVHPKKVEVLVTQEEAVDTGDKVVFESIPETKKTVHFTEPTAKSTKSCEGNPVSPVVGEDSPIDHSQSDVPKKGGPLQLGERALHPKQGHSGDTTPKGGEDAFSGPEEDDQSVQQVLISPDAALPNEKDCGTEGPDQPVTECHSTDSHVKSAEELPTPEDSGWQAETLDLNSLISDQDASLAASVEDGDRNGGNTTVVGNEQEQCTASNVDSCEVIGCDPPTKAQGDISNVQLKSDVILGNTASTSAAITGADNINIIGGQDAPEMDESITEVSMGSSDTTESGHGTDDPLSESSRTLTGDDFQNVPDELRLLKEKAQSDLEEVVCETSETSQTEVKEAQGKKTVQLESSTYVKTMLEEAMTESVKDTDSHSSSTTDKSSEMVRIESGLNSGHTSGDEVDTTTSSDIEIISTPTPNGENRHERPFDLSPLRHALSKTMRRGSPPGHKRSDSSSSAHSTWSKNEDDTHVDSASHREQDHAWSKGKHHGAEQVQNKDSEGDAVDEEEKANNPLDTQALLKKLAEMAEILEVREKKLVELSRENIDLHESKAILKNQLQQSEEARESELEDLNSVSEEFTARIADFEGKLHVLSKERDALRKQLTEAEQDIMKKCSSSNNMEKLMREKDQQIVELLDEGEKLSKQQLQSNNIIKKLRAKEKDNDAVIKTYKQKLDKQTEELNHLHTVLDAKEEHEKSRIETITQQNNAVKRQEAELAQLQLELEDFQEKSRGLQAALDNSYREISELHKANAAAISETATAKLSVEMSAKQELQLAMERQTITHKQEMDSLLSQIEDMQLSIVRQEREQGRREDVLRQEIAELQQRLQEAEERNQDLTQSVTSATRPLLRQIENLQSTYTAQSGSYEKVERNLTDRLHEAQVALGQAVEKERASSERLIEVTSQLSSLEAQATLLRQEKSQLQAQLEVEKTRFLLLEDTKNSESAQIAAMKTDFTKQIKDLQKEKVMLENQVEMEKMHAEAEKKKLLIAHEQLRDKELQLQQKGVSGDSHSSIQDQADTSSNSPLAISIIQEDILDKSHPIGAPNGNKANLYETLRHTGATLIENLQSQLKMKEGEILHLQSEITELERTREAMARELVNMSTENDKLKEQLEEYPELKKAHEELDSRYNALLQMYGEKVEEADELNMDLQDVKDMYKTQIEELLKRIR